MAEVLGFRSLGIQLPNKQRQHRTLHLQKDVLPYALCQLLCPVSAALASIFRMDSISTYGHTPSRFSGFGCGDLRRCVCSAP